MAGSTATSSTASNMPVSRAFQVATIRNGAKSGVMPAPAAHTVARPRVTISQQHLKTVIAPVTQPAQNQVEQNPSYFTNEFEVDQFIGSAGATPSASRFLKKLNQYGKVRNHQSQLVMSEAHNLPGEYTYDDMAAGYASFMQNAGPKQPEKLIVGGDDNVKVTSINDIRSLINVKSKAELVSDARGAIHHVPKH